MPTVLPSNMNKDQEEAYLCKYLSFLLYYTALNSTVIQTGVKFSIANPIWMDHRMGFNLCEKLVLVNLLMIGRENGLVFGYQIS